MTNLSIPETLLRTREAFDGAGDRTRIANELRQLALHDPEFNQRPRTTVLSFAHRIAPETAEKPS